MMVAADLPVAGGGAYRTASGPTEGRLVCILPGRQTEIRNHRPGRQPRQCWPRVPRNNRSRRGQSHKIRHQRERYQLVQRVIIIQ